MYGPATPRSWAGRPGWPCSARHCRAPCCPNSAWRGSCSDQVPAASSCWFSRRSRASRPRLSSGRRASKSRNSPPGACNCSGRSRRTSANGASCAAGSLRRCSGNWPRWQCRVPRSGCPLYRRTSRTAPAISPRWPRGCARRIRRAGRRRSRRAFFSTPASTVGLSPAAATGLAWRGTARRMTMARPRPTSPPWRAAPKAARSGSSARRRGQCRRPLPQAGHDRRARAAFRSI